MFDFRTRKPTCSMKKVCFLVRKTKKTKKQTFANQGAGSRLMVLKCCFFRFFVFLARKQMFFIEEVGFLARKSTFSHFCNTSNGKKYFFQWISQKCFFSN